MRTVLTDNRDVWEEDHLQGEAGRHVQGVYPSYIHREAYREVYLPLRTLPREAYMGEIPLSGPSQGDIYGRNTLQDPLGRHIWEKYPLRTPLGGI